MKFYNYENLIGEGKSSRKGKEARKDIGIIYLRDKGSCFQGYCDISFDSQDKYIKAKISE